MVLQQTQFPTNMPSQGSLIAVIVSFTDKNNYLYMLYTKGLVVKDAFSVWKNKEKG